MTLYLDTSSLVKIYVDEPGTDDVYDLLAGATLVATAAIAYPESRAALARRRRERALTQTAFASAKKALEADWPRYLIVDVTPELCGLAGELAERYRLRAYDALHLSAYAQLVQESGGGEVHFSSFDSRLNAAARSLSRTLRRRP